MKEVGGASGVAGVAPTKGVGLQHSAPCPRGATAPVGRRFTQLQRASRIACAWLGLAEAVGFRAPPPVGARDFSISSIARYTERPPTHPQSAADRLSAPIPAAPNRRLAVGADSDPEFGSVPIPPENDRTFQDDQPSLQAAAASPLLPLDFSIQTHPEKPDLDVHPDRFAINSTATHADANTPAGRGPNLFREITIRPAPSAIIANPALAEIARFSDARRSGPVTYVVRLTQSAIHDSNVAASATNRRSDLQLSVGPALLAQLGNEETRWRIGGAYIGAFSDFVNRSAQQTFDHLGTLSLNSNTNRIRFSLQASAQKLTSSFPDIGERVTRTTLYGAGTMVCKWGEKLSSELNADFTDSTFDRFLSSKEYRLQSLHVYDFSAKTRIGIGSAAGKLVPSLGNTQLYVQGLARVEFRPSEKLFFNVLCGVDRREFETSGTHRLNPVYQGTASWYLTPKTSLTLNAGRRSFSSASLAFQNFAVSTMGISLIHQLTHSVSATITGEREKSVYSSASSGINADRIDHYYRGRLELAWTLKQWLSAGSFFELSENDSLGQGAQPFSRARVGVTVNLSF